MSQAPHKLGAAGKPAAAATGVADGNLSRQAAKRKLRGAQITRQKKKRACQSAGPFEFRAYARGYGYARTLAGTSAVTVPSTSLSCLPTVLWKIDGLPPLRATVALFFRRMLASPPLR
jgi:hypothetical protein